MFYAIFRCCNILVLLDNNFVVPSEKKLLDDTKYEERRNNYLRSADAAIVIFADSYHGLEQIQIVTEESNSINDGKLYKKIPLICEQLKIKTLRLPDYLKECEEVEVVFCKIGSVQN